MGVGLRSQGSTVLLRGRMGVSELQISDCSYSPPPRSKVALQLVSHTSLTAVTPTENKVTLQFVSCTFLTAATPPIGTLQPYDILILNRMITGRKKVSCRYIAEYIVIAYLHIGHKA